MSTNPFLQKKGLNPKKPKPFFTKKGFKSQKKEKKKK